MSVEAKGLQIKNLHKEYTTGVPVLRGIHLDVKPGSFVSLLGPSGCGKSTVLGCLAGLTDITSGEIYFHGKRLDTMPAQKRNIGMVFQNYALFPHLTAFNNVAFGLKIKGLSKTEISTKVKAALAAMRLSEFENRFPGELSGGQQQRLAFARTIVMEPGLLLLDEPLSNLDAKLREELKIEIKKLHQKLKVTMVHVTHDQSEAMSLSDVVVLLNQGKIEQAGAPEELYLKPSTLFVADFVGYKNQFAVTVEEISQNTIKIKFGSSSLSVAARELAVDQLEALKNSKPSSNFVCALRPSDLSVSSNSPIKMKVVLTEYHGLKYQISGNILNQSAYLETATKTIANQDVGVKIDWSKARFYAK